MTRDAADPPVDPWRPSAVWIADTGLFVACGRERNPKHVALERFARRNGITFVLPQRVYDELHAAPDRSGAEPAPIDTAIERGWVRVADPLDYADGTVSAVMDDARSAIAASSNRDEDRVEKADAALAGLAVQLLQDGRAPFAYVVTTDRVAGDAVVAAVDAHGFEGQIEFVDGFDLLDEIG